MKIMIMRHGEAAMHAPSDAERPLTENGRIHCVQTAKWLNEKLATMNQRSIDHVLVSPYLRAQQTRDAVLSVLTTKDVETLGSLTPGGNEETVADYLRVLAERGTQSVLVISHLPLVGYLVAELCPEAGAPMFATSAVVGIAFDAEQDKGEIEWFYHG